MRVTRKELADHIAEYSNVIDNPEYGGNLVDWVWDWLWQRGSLAPATGPDIHWLQLKEEKK